MEETIILNALLMKDNHLNETSLPDPGASQNMTIKYLSVGQMSRFIYQQIALDVLFQMRYNSLPNSNKQPNDSLRAEATPCFHITPVLLFSVVLLPVLAELLRGLPTSPFILVCHSVTPWSISSCHTSSERGLKYLSYNPNCLYITLQISLCEHQS